MRETRVGSAVNSRANPTLSRDTVSTSSTSPTLSSSPKAAAGEHPVAVPTDRNEDEIEGTVLSVTEADLHAADDYEVDDQRVAMALRSGRKAWVYVETGTHSSEKAA